MARTLRCTDTTRAGRLAKAQQFWSAAQTIEAFAGDETSVSDAYTTLAVHAGIAAADVICCARLGQHALEAMTTTNPWRSWPRPTETGPGISPRCSE